MANIVADGVVACRHRFWSRLVAKRSTLIDPRGGGAIVKLRPVDRGAAEYPICLGAVLRISLVDAHYAQRVGHRFRVVERPGEHNNYVARLDVTPLQHGLHTEV